MTDSDLDSGPDQPAPRSDPATPPPARGHWLLITVLVGAAGAALLAAAPIGGTSAVPATTSAVPAPVATPAADWSTEAATNVIAGTVLERLDVDKYTYLRLDTGQPGGAWAAVASAQVAIGDKVRIIDAQLMTAFTSATLKRTFESIYFGVLDDGSARAARPRQPAGMFATDPHGASNPHGASGVAPSALAVGNVRKAEGPTGRTVSEVHAQRGALKGKAVRVRGVVVKVVTGVLDRSFVRVRDGSETAEVKDLLVTTQATPAVGARVLVEGKVAIDKDYGAGYVYAVVVEDAVVTAE